jgi:hypothetical protein
MLLILGRHEESRLTTHRAPTEGEYLMGRSLMLVVPMLVAVVVISGVTLALSACGGQENKKSASGGSAAIDFRESHHHRAGNKGENGAGTLRSLPRSTAILYA